MRSYFADRLSLHQVAQQVGVHVATCWRWALHGVKGRKLKTFSVGGRRYVKKSDLDAFLAAGDETHGIGTEAHVRRAEDFGRLLDGAGVGKVRAKEGRIPS